MSEPVWTSPMRTTGSRSRRAPLLSVAVCLMIGGSVAALLAGCKPKQEQPAHSQQSSSARTVSYTVRGLVAQLPAPDAPTTQFMVRHESMPHYQRPDGSLGMNSMTMPFPPAPGLSLDGLVVGDIIELTFDVDYDAASGGILGFHSKAFKKLSADTVLDFSPLKPTAEAEP